MPALEMAGRSPSLTVSAAAAGSAIARRRARTVAARRVGRVIGYASGGAMWGCARSLAQPLTVPPHPAPLTLPSPQGGEGELDGPGLAAPAHVPEHPLVAAGGHEVAVHGRALVRPERAGEGVGAGEHRAHHRAELLGGGGADPAGGERIARARAP